MQEGTWSINAHIKLDYCRNTSVSGWYEARSKQAVLAWMDQLLLLIIILLFWHFHHRLVPSSNYLRSRWNRKRFNSLFSLEFSTESIYLLLKHIYLKMVLRNSNRFTTPHSANPVILSKQHPKMWHLAQRLMTEVDVLKEDTTRLRPQIITSRLLHKLDFQWSFSLPNQNQLYSQNAKSQ